MLANNIIRQIFTQIIGLFSGLVTSVITARILGPEGRGEFSLILNTSSLLSFILGFSFGTSIIHVFSSNKMPERKTINSFLVLIYGLLLISIITIYCFPEKYYSLFIPVDKNSTYYLVILFILFLFTLFNSLFTSVLSGKKLFKQQQLVFSLVSAFSIVLYATIFLFKQKYNIGLLNFLVFYILVSSIPVIGFFIVYIKNARPEFSFTFLNIKQLKYLLSFSFMAYIGSILHFLSCRMDFWFVEYYNGSKDLGFYSLASNLSQMLWIIPQAISSILISYAAGDNINKSIINTNSLSRITVGILSIASLFLLLTIGFIIPFLFGEEYNNSIILFKLLLMGVVPFSIVTILSSFFIGIGKMKINLMTSFISFFLCFIFDLFLIPIYGVEGAAYASVIAYLSSTVFIIIIYIKLSRSKLKDLLIPSYNDFNVILDKIGRKKSN